jgi:hypothetical protein
MKPAAGDSSPPPVQAEISSRPKRCPLLFYRNSRKKVLGSPRSTIFLHVVPAFRDPKFKFFYKLIQDQRHLKNCSGVIRTDSPHIKFISIQN